VARWRRRLPILALAILVVAAGAVGVAWYLARDYLRSPGPLRAPASVELPRGSGVAAIAAKLADAGAIEHPWAFAALARATGRDRDLKAGEYAIEPRMSPQDILALLESGRVLLHPVAVPEGLTVHEVYGVLRASDVLSGDQPPLPREGTLLPETYLVPRDEARARLVERMRADMRAALDQLWAGRDPDLPLRTPEEALTLASIIEKETAKPEEYRLVAAVFVNRLRRGMKLQTDPTVIYALADGQGALGRELRSPTRAGRPWPRRSTRPRSTTSTSSRTGAAGTRSRRPWRSTTATSPAGASCARTEAEAACHTALTKYARTWAASGSW
jgi:UPF0755 protein